MSVYFAEREGLIKIGYSRSVPSRMSALGAKLIGAVPGDKTIESELHARFAHLRMNGEWFKPDEALLSYIRDKAQTHKPDSESVQWALKLPKSFLGRADKLAEQMSEPGFRYTRTDVLRMAMFEGVERLEAGRKKR